MTDDKNPLYFFLHIPKTGGTSFAALLEQRYGDRHIRIMNGTNPENRKQVMEIMQTEPDKYDCITAHVPGFGVHEGAARPVRYITILRDPAARVLSLYYKVKRNTDDHRHAKISQFSEIEEALAQFRPDVQTANIAGASPDGPVTAAHLETAKQNLEQWFDVVAILERLDESLLQMRRAMGWKAPIPMLPHQNAGSNRPKQTPEQIYNLVREMNKYDMALYQFASELLDRRISALGITYQRDRLQQQARQTLRQVKSIFRKPSS